jgi:hypothetical protein
MTESLRDRIIEIEADTTKSDLMNRTAIPPSPRLRGEGPALSPEEREKYFGAFFLNGPNACANAN